MNRILSRALALVHTVIEYASIDGGRIIVGVRPWTSFGLRCPVCGRAANATTGRQGRGCGARWTVFGNGFLDILAARFRQSGKRTADVSDFCLPEHQGLVHPLARAVELDESSMVDHPVDHRGGKLVVAQDRSPFAELDVGGEHHASLLVAC